MGDDVPQTNQQVGRQNTAIDMHGDTTVSHMNGPNILNLVGRRSVVLKNFQAGFDLGPHLRLNLSIRHQAVRTGSRETAHGAVGHSAAVEVIRDDGQDAVERSGSGGVLDEK